MFSGRRAQTSPDLSSSEPCHVTSMERMFGGCSSLTSLDLSSFNTSNVTDVRELFYYCNSLQSILVSDMWTINHISENNKTRMFDNCGVDSVTYQ